MKRETSKVLLQKIIPIISWKIFWSTEIFRSFFAFGKNPIKAADDDDDDNDNDCDNADDGDSDDDNVNNDAG